MGYEDKIKAKLQEFEKKSSLTKKSFPGKKKEPLKEYTYVIYDSEDGDIAFEGNEEECKEYWWDELRSSSNVGGWSYSTKLDWEKEFGEN